MYPDWAFYEFYPMEIVDRIRKENPGATVERLNELMQAAWDAVKSQQSSLAQFKLADDDDLGL